MSLQCGSGVSRHMVDSCLLLANIHDSSSSTPADYTGSGFNALSDKAKVEQIFFLFDKYGGGG